MRCASIALSLLLLFGACQSKAIDEACVTWFSGSRLKPNTKECFPSCLVMKDDLATFFCHESCEELCRKSCPDLKYWSDKIKEGRPTDWPIPGEKTVPWNKSDRAVLKSALNRLPRALQPQNFVGIFRMQKSVQIINPATAHDGAISLYDRAFNGMFPLPNVAIPKKTSRPIFRRI